MIQSEEDKKLVDQYKQTNLALRKQLSNLNNEIDRILIKKSSKIGLQKLPNVVKKITDPTVMQHEIENSRKRLEQLERDLELYKGKAAINYYQKIKELEAEVQDRDSQMEECRRLIREYERKDKIADVQATKNHQSKAQQRIAKLQEEISRCQKVEKDLIREINCQEVSQQKTSGYIQELAIRHNEAAVKKEKELREKSPPKPIDKGSASVSRASIGEEEWRELKKQFLVFKESKQNEQFSLNEENERLRAEIKEWERKIKEKKKRIESVNENLERSKDRQSRVYSTLGDPNDNKVYRYRDRNNSVQYNTKT